MILIGKVKILTKKLKERLLPRRLFKNKISNLLNTIYSQESSDVLIHNKGKIVREGKGLFDLEHDFTDGIYLRRMMLNKGTTIISGIHRRDHVWFLMIGSITVSDQDGVTNYEAPYIGFSKSGTQRVIYANEYSVFQNVFQNPQRLSDLDELEDFNYIMEYKV
jgi:hypothetical protein